MVCKYCGASNPEDEHRCDRCGRRLHPSSARPAPELYPLSGAHALAPEPVHQPRPVAVAPPPLQQQMPEPRRGDVQAPLFPVMEVSRVVPMPGVRPRRTNTRRAETSRHGVAPAGVVAHQQTLAFPAPSTSRARATNDDRRASHAPVAIPIHRGMAAVADFSLVVVATALAAASCYGLSAYAYGDGALLVNAATMPWFGAFGFFLAFIYKLLWALAGIDSPGVRWTSLRLLNFDGYPPTRTQRLQRTAAGCLSLLAGTLGLIWALVDEEKLSWHDHMSKTFLTSSVDAFGFQR